MDSTDLVKHFNFELGDIVGKTASIIDSQGQLQCSTGKRTLGLNVGEMCMLFSPAVARVKALKGSHFWPAISRMNGKNCEVNAIVHKQELKLFLE
eukprot:1282915-Rhodomonas_salina.1